MKLHYKDFATPRAMLRLQVVRDVFDFVNQCEHTMLLFGELNRPEYGWLQFIEGRIERMVQKCPDFGGNMQKCLSEYEKFLPQIKRLLQ